MQDSEPTRAQRMAAQLKADQARLIAEGVLPPSTVGAALLEQVCGK